MYKIYELKKKVLILVLNKARDGPQRAAGDSNCHEMGAPSGKALSPYVPSLVLGTPCRRLCAKSGERGQVGTTAQQTAEILGSEAVQGFVREDQDFVVNTGRHGGQCSSLHTGVICGNLGVSVKILAALFRICCSLLVRDRLIL